MEFDNVCDMVRMYTNQDTRRGGSLQDSAGVHGATSGRRIEAVAECPVELRSVGT